MDCLSHFFSGMCGSDVAQPSWSCPGVPMTSTQPKSPVRVLVWWNGHSTNRCSWLPRKLDVRSPRPRFAGSTAAVGDWGMWTLLRLAFRPGCLFIADLSHKLDCEYFTGLFCVTWMLWSSRAMILCPTIRQYPFRGNHLYCGQLGKRPLRQIPEQEL